MEKSASENISNSRPLPRRSPRTDPTETLLNIKQCMKLKAEQVKHEEFVKDDYEVAQEAKNLFGGETGIVFDNEMVKHYCLWDRNYPECPERYICVIERCNELGLIDRCKRIPSRMATDDELMELHSPEHIEVLKATENVEVYDTLEELSGKFDSIYINKSSYKCAAIAAGCAISLVDAICKDEIQNGMAIIRPPGHHAMRSEYCGYCFFNNVALATNHALKNYKLNRILVVDWDVHHGQSTQKFFYDDPRVIYFSIHRYENGTFWPELKESDYHYVGEKSGRGFNFNVPLNKIGAKDADYIAIFQQILIPLAYQFIPELVIVSAGYDSAVGCPEGEMEITPACYSHLVSHLFPFSKGKVAVVLEGGYFPKSLAEGAAMTLRTLLTDCVPSLHDFGIPSDSVVESILNVLSVQKSFWPCYVIQDTYVSDVSASEYALLKKLHPENHYPVICYRGKNIQEKPLAYETRNCYPQHSVELSRYYEEKLASLILKTDLSLPPNRVAIAYEESMLQHQNLSEFDHPEKPERIDSIFNKHVEYGLLDRCMLLKGRLATIQELGLIHSERYLLSMKETEKLSTEELIKKGKQYDSVYFHPKSFECASLACGCLLQLVDEVVLRRSRSGVAIVRPPGHHAESDSACGFCLFNNVAIAAKYAIKCHGLKRVLLLDWDVHHGNGTQRAFEADDRVLYISLHRYNNGKYFPCSTDADYDKVGVGKGEGFNVNIPWNKRGGGMTDGDYISAFLSIVLPIAYKFDPELVLVSAGFDACVNDPLGNCKVSPEAYAHMTHWLTTLANGRVILSLEGGYNVSSISYALTLCTKTLLGDPVPPLKPSALIPSQSALESIRNVLKVQAKYWSCLKFNKALPDEFQDNVAEASGNSNYTKAQKEELNDYILENKSVRAPHPVKKVSTNYHPDDDGRRSNRNRLPPRDNDPDNANGASTGPTLVEYLSENMQRLLNEEMFAVIPLPGCPHLPEVQAVPQSGIDARSPCANCDSTQENWICLICYSVHCGRYVNEHMVMHNQETQHPLTLSFTDLSVWCYVCEAYIDNMVLYPAKNAVHRSKFGSDLQWCYGVEERHEEVNTAD